MEILKLGPLGEYKHENHWEETCTDPISHIFVTFDSGSVTSIQFGYVRNGALALLKKYGETNTVDHSTRIVRLNHKSENVTGISGECYYSHCIFWKERYPHISSLTFHTKEGKYEAFHLEPDCGRAPRREFHSGIRDCREFTSFFGSFGECRPNKLCFIDLYVRHVL